MWELYIDGGWLVPRLCVSVLRTLVSIDTCLLFRWMCDASNLGSCTVTWARWGLGSGCGLDLEWIELDFPVHDYLLRGLL
jgi:hypothetical protein